MEKKDRKLSGGKNDYLAGGKISIKKGPLSRPFQDINGKHIAIYGKSG